ncbi:hypothetical protein EPB68_14285 [Enterococcus faecalis]|uniref:hypothetical protein n=1 Tax=Enterococcus TaxID=1350 RepID=UPI00102636FA|nr:hypothetical protein [Enterococcus faecalis]MBC2813725.1 hypothetical protein [Enterococcus faecalis]MBC2816836.1 hypothetical protein [Enterococcus faecalis]MBC2833574.1 hypothetical protein [Enterococcus faecalis]MBC2849533.1 hypothetical protein [Enterococcus faecalis]RXK46376.1 hypothetical protein EPB68_14285 [Enterococcus faecalis]
MYVAFVEDGIVLKRGGDICILRDHTGTNVFILSENVANYLRTSSDNYEIYQLVPINKGDMAVKINKQKEPQSFADE